MSKTVQQWGTDQGLTQEAEIKRLREENERLREALSAIVRMTNPDDPESYRADDREGCLDTVWTRAKKALGEP